MGMPPTIPSPPGGAPQGPSAPPMTSPMAVSPDPAQSGGMANQAAFSTLQIVQATRALAKQFPDVAPLARQINDLVQQMQMKIGQQSDQGEPSAPPIG